MEDENKYPNHLPHQYPSANRSWAKKSIVQQYQFDPFQNEQNQDDILYFNKPSQNILYNEMDSNNSPHNYFQLDIEDRVSNFLIPQGQPPMQDFQPSEVDPYSNKPSKF